MDRSEFVHVIGLVAARTGVEEGEQSRDEERALVVSDGIWSGKDSARLTVHSLAVAEEKALARRVVLVENTALPHETLVHQRTVADLHAGGDNEIRALDATAQANGCIAIAVDRTVLEAADTSQLGVIAYPHVFDGSAVEDTHVRAYLAVIRSLRLRVGINHRLHRVNHLGTMAVEGQYIRQAGAQFVEDRDLASTALVHYRHAYAVAEGGTTVHEHRVDVLDTGVVADTVVGNVVVDIENMHIVAYLAVVDSGVVDTRMHAQSSGQFELAVEHPQDIMS